MNAGTVVVITNGTELHGKRGVLLYRPWADEKRTRVRDAWRVDVEGRGDSFVFRDSEVTPA